MRAMAMDKRDTPEVMATSSTEDMFTYFARFEKLLETSAGRFQIAGFETQRWLLLRTPFTVGCDKASPTSPCFIIPFHDQCISNRARLQCAYATTLMRVPLNGSTQCRSRPPLK